MSIRDDFFTAKNNGAKWDVGVSINRTNPLPLDVNSVFDTKENLDAYVAGVLSYPGQLVALVEATGTTIYYIDENKSLQEVGKKPVGDNKTISVAEDGTISLTDFAEAATGAQLLKGPDGKIVWQLPDTSTVDGLSTRLTSLEGNLTNNYYTKTEVDARDAGAFHFKGNASKIENGKLYNSDNEEITGTAGDVYQLSDKEYAYNGSEWVELGFTLDLSNYYTKTEVDTELAKKADSATTLSGYGITDAYTKTEVDTELAKKADSATTISGYGITDAYTKTETDTLLDDKEKEIERLNYYGNKNIIPSDESYFVVNATGETITGLTDDGKTQTELVIPYKINGVKITNLHSNDVGGTSILDGNTVITKVILPNTITTIDEFAFLYCESLTSINIPDSVTSIGLAAFDLTALTSIEIPNSVTSIGNSAFGECTSLTSIEIPSSVTSIDTDAFTGITPANLTVYCEQGSYADTYATNKGFNIVYTDISKDTIDALATDEELERLKYYGDKDIVPSDSSYFVVNATKETITGLTDAGKTQTELVIPYKINGVEITNLHSNGDGTSILDGNTVITKVILPNTITTIDEFAFLNCTSLTSINIPDGITSIGTAAFQQTALTSIEIPNSVTSIGMSAFQGCTSLKSITIPNSVTSIDSSAFQGCTSLTSIEIPNSVTNISGAFRDCTSLKSITIPNSVSAIDSAFQGCTSLTSVEIPNSVTSTSCAFQNCTSLKSIHIPDSVTSIGDDAFDGCTSLTSIEIPNSVTDIGGGAFAGITPANLTVYCEQGSYAETYAKTNGFNIVYTDVSDITTTEELERLQYYGDKDIVPSNSSYFVVNTTGETITGLTDTGKTQTELVIPYEINGVEITKLSANDEGTSILDGNTVITKVVLPNTITTIGWFAFHERATLTSINIPDSVTSIENGAFNGCTSLASIELPNSLTSIGDFPFQNTALKSISIPNGVKYIGGDFAFSGCSSLTSIEIPNSVISLPMSAFSGCSSLTSIELPNSITTIYDNAFSGCSSLKTIEIPNGVATIEYETFLNCTSLKSVKIPSSVTSIGEGAFHIYNTDTKSYTPISGLTIYCEQGSYAETYAKTNGFNIVYSDVSDIATETELERLKYYGDKDIVPSDSSYFVVNATGETITGLTDTGKTQTELVIPYKINGKEITTFAGPDEGTSALDGNTVITKVVLPNTITTIGWFAFYNCSTLTSVNIPDSVTVIENNAFCACSALTSINIPDGVTSIGEQAFGDCTSLKSISIPNSVTDIGYYAFAGCTSLKSINIPDGSGMGEFAGCTSLKSISIPNGVTTITSTTFEGCTSLTSVEIPNSVTSIDADAFSGCTSLKSIELPNSVTTIDFNAFENCASLTSVEIPSSVTSIGEGAFHIYNTDTKSYTPISGLTIYCEQGSYAETYATNNGFNIVYTDIDKTYISDTINNAIKANDAMTFKGLLGGDGNITSLPTENVKNGDTYKVAVSGTYNEVEAKAGDMFIALVKSSTVTWQYIPSADDGNVLANDTLTNNQLVIGGGSKTVATLSAGTSNQILRVNNSGVPTWSNELSVTSDDNSLEVSTTDNVSNIKVKSVDVSKISQTSDTVLVLNGGNSSF